MIRIYWYFYFKIILFPGLGFSILGGKDAPYLPWDDGIFISKVTDGGAAALDGRLQKGDKIIEVNTYVN